MMISVGTTQDDGVWIEITNDGKELTVVMPKDCSRSYFVAKLGAVRSAGIVASLDGAMSLYRWIQTDGIWTVEGLDIG
jgi:hypothetical protein